MLHPLRHPLHSRSSALLPNLTRGPNQVTSSPRITFRPSAIPFSHPPQPHSPNMLPAVASTRNWPPTLRPLPTSFCPRSHLCDSRSCRYHCALRCRSSTFFLLARVYVAQASPVPPDPIPCRPDFSPFRRSGGCFRSHPYPVATKLPLKWRPRVYVCSANVDEVPSFPFGVRQFSIHANARAIFDPKAVHAWGCNV